ncbi:hypothetical protein GALL_508380 [mine drainage metagenome]|uniref:Uncharacterized protein n=1 Tax=mine drainage metagenome TaxID=410659 RepID=A0A1J5PJ64_9ZZZZ
MRVKPCQEFDHCRAVAQVRLCHARDLGRVLARLGQQAGISPPRDDDLRLGQRLADGEGRGGAVNADRAGERAKRGGKGGRGANREIGADMGAGGVVELRRVDVKRHASIAMQDRESVDDRVAGDVAAADVEQPAD